jgi:hypothetical protein
VTGVVYYPQFGLWPGAVQIPRAAYRTDNIVATLNNDGWDSPDDVDRIQQLPFSDGASMGEVVTPDAQRWLSSRVPALLEVNAVVRIGAKVTGSVRLDGWVQDLCEAHSYSSMTVVNAWKKAYFDKCANQQARPHY